MVLGTLFRRVAQAGAQQYIRNAGHAKDEVISFVSITQVPELRTLVAAPDQLRSERLRVVHDHHAHKLLVVFEDGLRLTFLFREDHIAVLSKQPFDHVDFRDRLKEFMG